MRGYGVPDGLATLALDKTRCAPIPARNVATSSRPPARRQKLRRLRVAWGPLPSWASGRWPSRRGDRTHVDLRGLTRSGWPCGRLRAPLRGLSRAPLACARSPRALYLEEAAQEVFRSAPKSRRSSSRPRTRNQSQWRTVFRSRVRSSRNPKQVGRAAARSSHATRPIAKRAC